MNLWGSLEALGRVIKDDVRLVSRGAPIGWYARTHYEGRLARRRGQQPAVRHVSLTIRQRSVDLRLTAANLGTMAGVFIDDEYDCRELVSPAPKRILDFGANVGFGALYLNLLWPGSEFICVEPDPRNLPVLRANLERNGLNALVQQSAVGAERRVANLRFDEDPGCSALDSSPMHAHRWSVAVEVTTVDALLESAQWEDVDLVKMDIEGTEEELLSTNNSWLERVGALVFEIHPNTSPARIASHIRPFGFGLRRLANGREPVFFASRQLPVSAGE